MLFGHLGHGPYDPTVNCVPPRERLQQTQPGAIKYSSGSLSIRGDSKFTRNLDHHNMPPQAALLPGKDSASHGISSSVLHGTLASRCGLYFGLMIWVNGSILLTDGSLPGMPEKSGFQTSKAGGQRLGNAPR